MSRMESKSQELRAKSQSRTRFRRAVSAGNGRGALTAAGHLFAKPKEHICWWRTLPDYALVYVHGGGGGYQDKENGEIKIVAGNMIVLFPGMAHSYWPAPEWHESFLVFQGNVFEQLERDGLISRSSPVLNPGLAPSLIASFNRLIRDFLEHELPSDAVLTARIHLLMAEVVDLHRSQSRVSEKENFSRAAAALLEQHLDTELDLGVVARQFHLSYERFRKRFAAEVGVSPARYRMLRRIDLAKTLLAENELPIKAIAEQLGYCDLYFFCRQFKQLAGQTPAAFRRSV